MKKVILVLATLLVLVVSCKKEDIKPTSQEKQIYSCTFTNSCKEIEIGTAPEPFKYFTHIESRQMLPEEITQLQADSTYDVILSTPIYNYHGYKSKRGIYRITCSVVIE